MLSYAFSPFTSKPFMPLYNFLRKNSFIRFSMSGIFYGVFLVNSSFFKRTRAIILEPLLKNSVNNGRLLIK
jgi:hypothetical protein